VTRPEQPHYPYPAGIEGYGRGGFRFAGMSHRGSLLCLPDGIWGWDVTRAADVTEGALERVFSQADRIDIFFLGTGERSELLADAVRARFRVLNIALDVTRTAYAANTYNILLAEGRKVGTGLIAVD